MTTVYSARNAKVRINGGAPLEIVKWFDVPNDYVDTLDAIKDGIVSGLGVPRNLMGDGTNYASTKAACDSWLPPIEPITFSVNIRDLRYGPDTKYARRPHPHNRRWRRRQEYHRQRMMRILRGLQG